MLFAVADNKIESLEKTIAWFEKHYPNSKCLFADNGQTLLRQLQKEKKYPDIIFMDMCMPVMDGCSTTFYLKMYHPAIKVIGFSTITDYEMIRQAFISGVDGFMWKNEVSLVLQHAITQVVNSQYYLDSRFSKKIDDDLFKKIINHKNQFWQRKNTDENILNIKITNRERQFLILITSAMSYKEIAELMCISLKPVENLAQRLFKKTGVNNIKDLVLFALKYGYSVQANFMFLEKNCWL